MKLLFTLSLSLGLAVANSGLAVANSGFDKIIFCEPACELIRPDGPFEMKAPEWNYAPEEGWPDAVEGAFPENTEWSQPSTRIPTVLPTRAPTGSPTPVNLCLLESQGEVLNSYLTENDDASQACNDWITAGWVCTGEWMSVYCAESCKGNCPAGNEDAKACLADTLRDGVQLYLGEGGAGGSCLSWANEIFGEGVDTQAQYSCEEGQDWMWQNCRSTCQGKCGVLSYVNTPSYHALSTELQLLGRQNYYGEKLTRKQLTSSAAYKAANKKQQKKFKKCRKEVVDNGCSQDVKADGCKLTNAGKCKGFIKKFL